MKFTSALSALAIVILALTPSACAVTPAAGADDPIEIDGQARVLDGERYLQYRVGINIAAPPDRVWGLLTDAPNYPQWNSTINEIGGSIALGEEIALKAKIDPDRTFELTVAEFDEPKKMVWADGGNAFSGVRTFTLTAREDGTTDFTMAEVLKGSMMGMIEGKLPDFRPSFEQFAADLKVAAEAG